jgi:hypothetical protein
MNYLNDTYAIERKCNNLIVILLNINFSSPLKEDAKHYISLCELVIEFKPILLIKSFPVNV